MSARTKMGLEIRSERSAVDRGMQLEPARMCGCLESMVS